MPYHLPEIYQEIKRKIGEIESNVYEKVEVLSAEAWVTPEPVDFKQKKSGEHKVVGLGQKWGDLWDCAWFHFTGIIPKTAAGKKVVLLIDVNGEGCVFDGAGCPVQGLTNVNSTFDYSLGKPGKRVVEITERAVGNEEIDLWVDAGCNDLFGSYQGSGELKDAYIAVCNEDIKNLYYDFVLLFELLEILPKESARTMSIGYALKDSALLLNTFSADEVNSAREILGKELSKGGGDPSLCISAVGHAHIDLAWLWPIRETKRKAARTFSTALNMLEKYPDYVFGASQPQLYEWAKEEYPLLYQRIKEMVMQGRWEPQGGMWVEADTNITGGEALVRQFLYGKRFFKTEFNKDMKVLWLPDVFGYTGSLPQIVKKCGCDYFMTIKLSWNSVNQFPHHTFMWEGIDGTQVLVHMPPEGTYNSSAAPRALLKSEHGYLDKGVSDECLLLFGIGDGGGGPGEEHLEMLKREKNLNGLAPVIQEPSIDFFQRLSNNALRYHKWVGELYLEKHQGTYTTQAKSKFYNRKMELCLRDAEILLSLNNILGDDIYPREILDTIWKEVLLYQFHDILPGSSIKRVYDESVGRYADMHQALEGLLKEALSRIARRVDTRPFDKPVLLANTLSWERRTWLETAHGWQQAVIPPMGYIVMDASQSGDVTGNECLRAEKHRLENDQVRVSFNEVGHITSIIDKEFSKELIPKGAAANQLVLYPDNGDAWDFSPLYNQKQGSTFALTASEPCMKGPYASVKQVYRYGHSQIVQEVRLTKGSKQIDFISQVDWYESDKLLKGLFPVAIRTSEVVCDIQYGTINRPTHTNTSWDLAKYEFCAHKWVDLSQPDYGVALLNDCKYGHKVEGNTIELHLLRSSNYPGTDADKGTHAFTYAIYPHAGNHIQGKVHQAGYALNIPAYHMELESANSGLKSSFTCVDVNKENIVIEAIKRAEDDKDTIFRLFECSGMSSSATVSFDAECVSVQLVDMMEQPLRDLAVLPGSQIILDFKPFEIHTIKVKFKSKG